MNTQEENISMIKSLYDAFGRRDINGTLAMLDPNVELGEPSNPFNPASGTHHGHAGFLEWANIGRQSEEILVLQPLKILTDHDSVAVIGTMKCLALPTGKTYESDFVHCVTIESGKVTKFQEFFDTYLAGEAFRQ